MLISAKDIVRQTAELYKNEYRHMLHYVSLLLVPTFLIGASGFVLQYLEDSGVVNETVNMSVYIAVAIIFSIINLWISIAFIRVVAKLLKKQEPKKPMDEMKEAEQTIIPMIWASILTVLATFGGFILFVIPGIIFIVWLSFTSQAIALDDQRPVAALKASKALVLGRWWQVAWRLIVPVIVFGVIVWALRAIISFPLSWIAVSLNSGFWSKTVVTFVLLINGLIGLLAIPLATIAPTLLYLELKKTPVTKKLKVKKE